jgi:anaphase-promoting complex subunit 10
VRVYLDIEADESYTPTKMGFWAGMSEGGLVEFGGWEYNPDTGGPGPRGWVSVDLSGVGGREGGSYVGDSDDDVGNGGIEMGSGKAKSKEAGGDVLKCMVLQVRITENHQNGKDTHVRGFQVFARDERRKGGGQGNGQVGKRKSQGKRKSGEVAAGVGKVGGAEGEDGGFGGLEEPDWMGEPELR